MILQREECFFYDHRSLDRDTPLPALCNDAGGLCDANDICASASQTIRVFVPLCGPPMATHMKEGAPQHADGASQCSDGRRPVLSTASRPKESIQSMFHPYS